MPDQRTKAGNIGDVVKHALLPELVSIYDKAQSHKWLYCETHAGFYEYDLDPFLRHTNGQWKGERRWAIGRLKQHFESLGLYGQELARSIPAGVYPGSIRLIDAVVSGKAEIHGRDLGTSQVESFPSKPGRIQVEMGDGYEMLARLPNRPRLVFCDPFWTDVNESAKVRHLIQVEDAVIVWYPLSGRTDKYRQWQQKKGYSFIEIAFAKKNTDDGWGGPDLKGAGLMLKGLPPEAFVTAMKIGETLKTIFDGNICERRSLDLTVTISHQL